MASRVDTKPIAHEILEAIDKGEFVPNGIKWLADQRARVMPAAWIKNDGPQQTVAGRRRRLWNDVETLLKEKGWQVEPRGRSCTSVGRITSDSVNWRSACVYA